MEKDFVQLRGPDEGGVREMPRAARSAGSAEQRMRERYGPTRIWNEYERGRNYNQAIELYDTVEQNENFYIGDQWNGVNAPDLDKPVFNILARVVKFFISSIMSDDIGVSLERFDEDESQKEILEMISAQFDEIMEDLNFRKKCREAIRNAAVDGDACLHFFFDPGIDADLQEEDEEPESSTVSWTGGKICGEIIENTHIHFGNPQSSDLQSQPYLLLVFRKLLRDAKRSAAAYGEDPELVQPDEDQDKHGDDPETGKVTVVRRYWREEDGRVWACEVCAGGTIRPPWCTGYTQYPVAWLPWEKVKNRYHGQAALTGLIPNQIYINKLYALAMQHVKRMAFPKVIYNRNLLPKGWDNRVGAAIGVPGDPGMAVASGFKAPDMSAQVLTLIDRVIEVTRDTMGASDASLGNIRPDNTSAIIATQKATSMPLELQKQEFYSFVEACVRIWLDMMAENYGVRMVTVKVGDQQSSGGTAGMLPGTAGEMPGVMSVGMLQGAPGGLQGQSAQGQSTAQPVTMRVPFDFSLLKNAELKLNVEVGAATYWSELMQVQTLDNLFNKQLLDAETYLENMPRGYIPARSELLKSLREQQAKAEQVALTQAAAMQGGGGVL